MRLTVAILLSLLIAPAVLAEEVYLTPETFVARSFDDNPPPASSLWLTGELKADIERVLGHPPEVLRLRYWRTGARSVWILEEIGKDKPITAGFVVDDGRLADSVVLAFRESRGWEIKYPAFTRQFDGTSLDAEQQLDHPVDGITGATLSVNAMRAMARLALLLDAHVQENDHP
ncbi:MAG: FMN-binding protein [Nevskiales bacterium]